jgi:archaellum biogenesis ATPase FlaH
MLPAGEYLRASFTGATRLVERIGLTEGGVGLVTGAGGEGKSVLGLNVALVWTGATLPLGEAIPAARTLRVMLFQVEDAPGMVQERLRMMLGSAPAPAGLFLYTRKEPMRFSGAKGRPNDRALDRLRVTLAKHAPIDVVIFDPLIYLHEAEENSSSEMTRWLVPFREVCRQAGTAPLIIHHAGWAGDGDDARGRGSTAIRAWSDFELALRAQTKGGRVLHRLNLVKANFAPRWKEPLTLELDSRTLRFSAVDEAGTLCPPDAFATWLEEDHNGVWTGARADLYTAMGKKFGCSERTAKAAVARAKVEGKIKDQGQRRPLGVVAYSPERLL